MYSKAYVMLFSGNMYDPYRNPGANNYEDGIPRQTEMDPPMEAHNPLGTRKYVLDTPDNHGGNGSFTNFSETQAFNNPDRPIVWFYDQNYQGEAPLELQPLLNLPPPYAF